MNYTAKRDAAEKYLKSAGLKVLDRSYTSANGTLDIIAVERGTIVAVVIMREIPRKLSDSGKNRLRRIAVDWMDSHGRRYDRVRADVVAVHLEGTGGYTIEHVRSMA